MKSVSRLHLSFFMLVLLLITGISRAETPHIFSTHLDITSRNRQTISSDQPTGFNLTWTSNTQHDPLPVQNTSTVVGDHIVLNASFPQVENITRSMLHIWDGMILNETRSLVNYSSGARIFNLDGTVNPDCFDWISITGIEIGDIVNITSNFTNTDCDFFVWDGSLDMAEFTRYNSILEMATLSKPEQGSVIWNSSSNVLHLACLNYDNADTGNWTYYIEIGNHIKKTSYGKSVILDTYLLDDMNQTYDIRVTGFTDSNDSIALFWDDIEICNFFTPELSIEHIIQSSIDYRTYNITWACSDKNIADTNYFEVWLSADEGNSYLLLDMNFTRTWFVWNSSGFIEDIYLIKIRAYSVDHSAGNQTLLSPPTSYWPGDYSEVISPPLGAGDLPHSVPPGYYSLDIGISSEVFYYFGSTGNYLEIYLSFDYYLPERVDFELYDNGSLWLQGTILTQGYNESYLVSIDGLSVGSHTLTFTIFGFTTVSESCNIEVLESTIPDDTSNTDPMNYFYSMIAAGISLGSISVIAVVLLLTIRKYREEMKGV